MMKQHKHKFKHALGVPILFFIAVFSLGVAATTHALDCGVLPTTVCNAAEEGGANDIEKTGVWGLLKLGVQIMTAGVAILAIAGIIYGSVLYISAGPSQEQVKKAKGIFLNVVIGIVAFAVMFGFLQWLIPGGVF